MSLAWLRPGLSFVSPFAFLLGKISTSIIPEFARIRCVTPNYLSDVVADEENKAQEENQAGIDDVDGKEDQRRLDPFGEGHGFFYELRNRLKRHGLLGRGDVFAGIVPMGAFGILGIEVLEKS